MPPCSSQRSSTCIHVSSSKSYAWSISAVMQVRSLRVEDEADVPMHL